MFNINQSKIIYVLLEKDRMLMEMNSEKK